jgi:hypothetical protein
MWMARNIYTEIKFHRECLFFFSIASLPRSVSSSITRGGNCKVLRTNSNALHGKTEMPRSRKALKSVFQPERCLTPILLWLVLATFFSREVLLLMLIEFELIWVLGMRRGNKKYLT